MTDLLIAQILAQYTKHGWELRRVLLSKETRGALAASLVELFGAVPIIDADSDAAWFSRASGHDGEAWELRRLSENPYALFEVFSAEDEEEVREEARREMESRLSQLRKFNETGH
jgi:hypothetical protein